MNPFTIAVLADSHIRMEDKGDGYDFYPSNQFANARSQFIIQKINQINPELVFHLGDVIYPIPALSTHEESVQNAYDMFKKLKSKLIVVPGNHDIGDKPNAWVPAPAVTEKSHIIYEKYWGKTYSSFDYEDCHFIMINSPVLNSGYQLENYDNVAEPARAWLLALLEKFDVEAVFTGHSHNFFYNKYRNTDIYVLPSVVFVRPDFSELFHIQPATEHEYGRNDIEKLGFFLVRVTKNGHRVQYIRTRGQIEDQGESIILQPTSLTEIPAEIPAAPVGVFLRHGWATPVEIPYANLDGFTRKFVRNDYGLAALLDLGINKLRVPLGDLVNPIIRERMRELRRFGHEFTIISTGIPNPQITQVLINHHELVHSWEVVVPMDQIPEAIQCIQELKLSNMVRIILSKLDTIKEQRTQGFEFSHFPSYGFQKEDHHQLSTLLAKSDANKAINGFVFRLSPQIKPWEGIQIAETLASDLDMTAVVHVQLPRESEGVAYIQDRQISNRIAETLAAAFDVNNMEIFLDTFVDHDRGYFPRNGLLDRSYNPRASYYVFRHLYHALNGLSEFRMNRIEQDINARVFSLETSEYHFVLLLSEEKEMSNDLCLTLTPNTCIQGVTGKWLNLWTGKMREFHWKQSSTNNNKITITIPSRRFDPALLIFKA